MPSPLRILFLAAEASPLVKVGGLADVAGSLPAVLRDMGHDVRVVLPLHPSLRELTQGTSPITQFSLDTKTDAQTATVFQLKQSENNSHLYLIDGPPLRTADAVYHTSVEQDAPKFVFFSLAALELARAISWQPDIVHAHDWHSAAAVYWLCTQGKHDPFFAHTASLITVHNLPYLGVGAGNTLEQYGLAPSNHALLPDWARHAPLPLALAHADGITTVSPTYAAEIQTPQFGCGLEHLLQFRTDHLWGILNALDTATWDPSRDQTLAARYDAHTLDRREQNKAALQRQLGLDMDSTVPLLGIVSRFDHQKGLDLALPALARWAEQGAQVVVVGTGDSELEQQYRDLVTRFPDRIAVTLKFDAQLATQIYGGADLLLMPSRYEPCGLSQMIAMRYG